MIIKSVTSETPKDVGGLEMFWLNLHAIWQN